MEIEISEDGFINMLRNQNGGALVDELDREMIKGIGSILDHGGTSEITLKLKIRRIKEFEKGVKIDHDVVAKHPKEDRVSGAMFISSGNGLLAQPQEQGSLDLEAAVVDNIHKLEEVKQHD